MGRLSWLLGLGLLLAGLGPARAEAPEEALAREFRPGAVTAFYLSRPEAAVPRAAVILLAGGEGSLSIVPGTQPPPAVAFGRGNFLVRSRRLLADQGLLVATLNAPSDQGGSMTPQFRLSAEHAADLGGLADFLRQTVPGIPVWLAGTSMGTLSAANGAVRLGGGVDGIILTSSITRAHRRNLYPGNGVLALELERIAVPAMVVSHKGDTCEITPAADAEPLLAAMSNSPRRGLYLAEGGAAARSGPCEAMSAHGYFGTEAAVVEAMAAFILESR